MEQTIIIKSEQYFTETEDKNISKLKLDYIRTQFSTYDPSRKYLHIQVGDYNNFNLYLEITPREAEKMFLELAAKAKAMSNVY